MKISIKGWLYESLLIDTGGSENGGIVSILIHGHPHTYIYIYTL